MSYDTDFINTFNEYYPFERYIVKNPKKINYLFDDVLLCELFIPSTEIKPIMHEGYFVGFTKICNDEIYIKLKCGDAEFRMAYFDFDEHIREEIRGIVVEDFGGCEWQSLYVEYDDEDANALKEALTEQYNLIKDKYGECKLKDGFIIENTNNLLNTNK